MSAEDVLRERYARVLERLDAVSLPDAAIALALAFCLGLFIFLVYKNATPGSCTPPASG